MQLFSNYLEKVFLKMCSVEGSKRSYDKTYGFTHYSSMFITFKKFMKNKNSVYDKNQTEKKT